MESALVNNPNFGTWTTLNMLGLTGTVGSSSNIPSVKAAAGVAMAKISNQVATYPLKAMSNGPITAPISDFSSYTRSSGAKFDYLV